MRRSTRFLLTAVILLSASVVFACSVPVFRYAMEQWRPDAFQVVVFYSGELTDDQKALVEKIEPTDLNADYVANAWVRAVNVDDAEPEVLAVWEEQKTDSLPWMVVRSPTKLEDPVTIASAEFTSKNVESLLNSPLRKDVTDRLLKGDSAVWVLLESGNEEADTAAAEILEGELKRLQGELKLPEIDQADVEQGFISIDPDELKLRFSFVRVSRDDPKEQEFVQMLLATEPDLRDPEFTEQPMALPIFGRGRSLYALIGKGINAETIEDASRFLTGACQCTVKAQNPGVDLLTSVDWDSLIVPTLERDTELPPLTGLAGFAPSTEDADETMADKTDSDSTGSDDGKTAVVASESESVNSGETTSVATTPPVRQSNSVFTIAVVVVGGMAMLVAVMSVVFGQKQT